MYPTLPFGPISLPTGPILTLLGVWVGLETASRYSKRMGVHPDEVWNAGLIAVLSGLIVARLWNVVQFWYVYAQEPLLIFSLRPSGFALLPGVVAGVVGWYIFLLRRKLNPLQVLAAFSVGALATGAVFGLAAFLTGGTLGIPSSLPWALPYFGETLHPVGLYRTVGLTIWLVVVLAVSDGSRPVQTVMLSLFGYGLVHLLADGFVAQPDATLGAIRISQLVGLGMALVAAFVLAQETGREPGLSDTPGDQGPGGSSPSGTPGGASS